MVKQPIAIAKMLGRKAVNAVRRQDERVFIAVPDARERLMEGLVEYLGDEAMWIDEYEEVAQWLTDNHGKGLMLIGRPGRGKTVLIHHVLPALLNQYCRLYVNCYTALELNEFDVDGKGKAHARYDKIRRENKIIALDDVGTEPDANVFGEHHCYFSELVDECERKQKLLLVSTNLNKQELTDRYQLRTFDRLTAITRRVFFTEGDSFRK